MNIIERIRSRVKVNEETGCWEWQWGKLSTGYGRIWLDGETRYAHRVSYFAFNPDGDQRLCVLHRCDNPPCVNPDHLFLGTDLDNVRDCKAKGRRRRQGGSTNTKAKLNELRVREILRLLSLGLSQYEIGQRFGVSQANICLIANGITWKDITTR